MGATCDQHSQQSTMGGVRMGVLLLVALASFSLVDGVVRNFPDNFIFGVATASYQIEGGWNAAGKGENIWDRLSHTTNLIPSGDTGDVACDSYNQYKRDVEMLVELGVDYYRFSLSWSRILPTGFTDKINPDGIRYYNDLIDELIANGITPMITLYHWDLPEPIQDLGGWTNPMMAKYFADYADVVFAAFGDRVKYWLTLNEPQVCCFLGYGIMAMAPAANMSGIGDYLCAHTMLLAHANAYRLYEDKYRGEQKGRVGLTLNSNWAEPSDSSPESMEASESANQFGLGWFANPIFSKDGDYPKVMKEKIGKNSMEQGFRFSRLPEFTKEQIEHIRGTFDFFGLNHYTSTMARKRNDNDKFRIPSYEHDGEAVHYYNESWPTAASPWLKVVPWGFTKLLGWIREKYDNPELMVFENGFSDKDGLDDIDRIYYYHQYLNAMLDAIDEGSKITAYTAWSLMDNFEWLAGYTERFGLYHVDFNSPERTRTPKASAAYYSDIIASKSIDSEFDLNFKK